MPIASFEDFEKTYMISDLYALKKINSTNSTNKFFLPRSY